MIVGGLRFIDAAPMLATVVDNGVDPSDPRVMTRTNEATKIVLDNLIPVGGMATFDVQATGTTLLLPPDLENALEVEVLNDATVRGSTDVTQGWYSLVSPSAYVDPGMAMDNPLVDQGMVPDPNDPSTLRRQYDYPGLTPNAVVRVTGAKRYIPIVQPTDYLIVQNIEGLKMIILSIERYENNARTEGDGYRQTGLQLFQAEVKKHLLDPTNSMKRRGAYEDDMVNFPQGSMAWTRARIALEVTGALMLGKIQLTRLLEMSELRLMEMEGGNWRGTFKEYSADVTGGIVLFPKDVLSVVAVDIDGHPLDLRSEMFQYIENGPGKHGTHYALIDRGEEYFPASGNTRRKYQLRASVVDTSHISAVCKLKWIAKAPGDQMTIKNFEALRLMSVSLLQDRQEKYKEAFASQGQALKVLKDELADYLKGIKHTLPVQVHGWAMGTDTGVL